MPRAHAIRKNTRFNNAQCFSEESKFSEYVLKIDDHAELHKFGNPYMSL